MRKEIILLKYGEVVMKGLNRSFFDGRIVQRVKFLLGSVYGKFTTEYSQSTLCVRGSDDADIDGAFEACNKVFGIISVCKGFECEKDMGDILECIKENVDILLGDAKTFRCSAKRSDKSFPLSSPEISAEAGGAILSVRHDMKVDVHEPEATIVVEIRDNYAFVHGKGEKGAGGMPVGTAGSGLLLLSGGIDSPVAGYMIAKRGVAIDATYFHAPPYTSEQAKQKVVDLAKLISVYTGPIRLHVVNFTDVQLAIIDKCPRDELTIIMRRYMMRIAEHFAHECKSLGLVTGESIGQVASQTMQSLAATNAVCSLPVYRPLIAFDKQDIVDIALKINTYETSIEPYEDCCTIFVAKHPVTKPIISVIERSERKLEGTVEALVEEAIRTVEVINIG